MLREVPMQAVRAVRRGFTLIELLAVILIISILVATLTPMVNDAIRAARVRGCASNLMEIHKALQLYYMQYKTMPTQSGVDFFASVISRKAIENTKANAEKLTCPAVDKSALALRDLPWEEWWSDLDRVDGSYSAYAGRDLKNHPLRQWPPSGNEPLIADDNDPENNHGTTTNVLYGDGNVHTFEIVELQEQGKVSKDEDRLVVGPESPVEDLTKLTLD
jgi:prepilin-type N-terminal cleavage/methylation domain-containing protein/prepilin-type processing-associated H-X9-DG protein